MKKKSNPIIYERYEQYSDYHLFIHILIRSFAFFTNKIKESVCVMDRHSMNHKLECVCLFVWSRWRPVWILFIINIPVSCRYMWSWSMEGAWKNFLNWNVTNVCNRVKRHQMNHFANLFFVRVCVFASFVCTDVIKKEGNGRER